MGMVMVDMAINTGDMEDMFMEAMVVLVDMDATNRQKKRRRM